MKKTLLFLFCLGTAVSASAQYYGFGCMTPMGAAIQAQSIAIQQMQNEILMMIQSQSANSCGTYVPMVTSAPVASYGEYVPTTPSNNSNWNQSSQSSRAVNCSSCNNSGKCSYCNGTGYARTGGLGINTLDSSKKCSHCGGSGICPICHGNHM